jgi:hypothetical protein
VIADAASVLGTPSASHATANAVKEAHDFVDTRAAVITNVRYLLAEAQDRQKYYADRHSRANTEVFEVGDKVLLSTKNILKDNIQKLHFNLN